MSFSIAQSSKPAGFCRICLDISDKFFEVFSFFLFRVDEEPSPTTVLVLRFGGLFLSNCCWRCFQLLERDCRFIARGDWAISHHSEVEAALFSESPWKIIAKITVYCRQLTPTSTPFWRVSMPPSARASGLSRRLNRVIAHPPCSALSTNFPSHPPSDAEPGI